MPTPSFELHRGPFGRLELVLLPSGERHADVVPVRAFPLAAPGEGLSLIGSDGRERLWIERLDALPPAQRALIGEDLAAREFVPVITRIRAASAFSTPSTWDVDTDRGPTRLVLKAEEDIRRLGGGRLLIAGSQGVQFLVPDRAALDRGSRKLLERFL